MPELLNRIPAGLLSLFQIKSLGENPSKFEDTVRPVVDLRKNYYQSLGLNIAANVGVGLDANDKGTAVAAITIPEDEIWVVVGIMSGVNITTFAANEFMVVSPGIDNVNAPNVAFYFANDQRRSNSSNLQMGFNDSDFTSVMFPDPIFLPGGSRIYSFVSRATGTTIKCTVVTRVLHYVLDK